MLSSVVNGVSMEPVIEDFSSLREEESLHPWVKVDLAGRPLLLKRLSILEDLTLNLIHRLCPSLRN